LGPIEVQRHNLFDLPDNQWMRTAALIMTSNWFKPSHLHFTMLSLCFHPALEEILSQTIHVWYISIYFPCIYHKNQPSVGKYTIHGPYGYGNVKPVEF